MIEDPLEDAKQKKDWLRHDACLYLQIKNSIESEVIGLVDHCEVCYLKKIIAELALLLLFIPDVKVQQAQQEKKVVMIFLNGLLLEFGMVKAQILSNSKIPSLDNAFTRVFRSESSPTGVSIPQSSSALISKNNNPWAPRAMDSNF
ncbi:putative Polyprotein [Cucumis melo var. makuwa]|uniref:Putative Polyprotein n=1 Tax=Cucumis melo var. makuwa TaxID=1194695 RepID=A0A5D3C9S8_CUCMM|nr:putative Polyprotein [Cucumis melo var. makuwa]